MRHSFRWSEEEINHKALSLQVSVYGFEEKKLEQSAHSWSIYTHITNTKPTGDDEFHTFAR